MGFCCAIHGTLDLILMEDDIIEIDHVPSAFDMFSNGDVKSWLG
jgi:hypothetical protein